MKKIKTVIVLICIFSLPFLGFSQPDPRHNGNGSNVGSTPVGSSPMGAPVDGGLGIMLVLGAIYGARKVKRIK